MVNIRRAYEVLFLGLFLFFLFITDLRYLKGWPVSLFLEATPLVAVATALTTHTIYRNLVWGLVIIAITMMVGRVWCNWMCPFGILHHFFGWIGNRRNTKQMIEVNRYRKIYAIKYYILAVMIAMAGLWIIPTAIDAPGQIWGAYQGAELRQTGISRVFAAVETGIARSAEEHKRTNSTLQIGLLDPIALTVRSMTTSVLPSVHKATESVYTEPREYWQAWIVGLVFIGFLVANWWIPRFFCRVVCPLGALLGIFSRFALWRIDRDPVRCTDCDLCLKSCEGASDPQGDLRKSECFVCLNCIDDCPHDALSFRFLPRKASEVAYPAVGRREMLLSGLFGLLFFPMTRLSGGVRKNWQRGVIRPPGSVAEDEFLRRCIKCDQCIRVCPTNVLQPALFEAGSGRAVDPHHDFEDGMVRAELHAVQPGLPDRRHSRNLDRREARDRAVRGKRASQDGYSVLQPGPLSPLGNGYQLRGLRRGVPGQPQGYLHPQRRGDRSLGGDARAQTALYRPGQVHRLRHLRARMPRQGRPRRLRHRRRRIPKQGPFAPALTGRGPRSRPGLGLKPMICPGRRREVADHDGSRRSLPTRSAGPPQHDTRRFRQSLDPSMVAHARRFRHESGNRTCITLSESNGFPRQSAVS